ncbi:hypothetical protein Syun_007289 [Stephania yunnanensis]|uniref:Uncharacterized protein n=1 Tax=Stephania yunnanensis TaxID=152371 RepID=A0AAP0KY87_9MAGN
MDRESKVFLSMETEEEVEVELNDTLMTLLNYIEDTQEQQQQEANNMATNQEEDERPWYLRDFF